MGNSRKLRALISILVLFGVALTCSALDEPEELYTFVSEESFPDRFGWAVAGAGDVNADGYDDLLVSSGNNEGYAYVFSGKDGTILYSYYGVKIGAIKENLGRSLCGLGDLNGDGYDDFAIGSPKSSDMLSGGGKIVVYSGKDGEAIRTTYGTVASAFYGWCVAPAGDVDRDGTPDYVVGSILRMKTAGYVYVYSGDDGQVIHKFTRTFNSGECHFGRAVSGAGDVDGDGYDDVLVGFGHHSLGTGNSPGAVIVYSGKDGKELYFRKGDQHHDGFGDAVAGVGDVNADGYDDFAAAANMESYGSSNRPAYVHVYSGKDGTRLHRFIGVASDTIRTVGRAGDLDGDGYADVLVGAPHADDNGTNSGAIVAYSGRTGDELFSFSGQAGDELGWSVRSAGDVNRDGRLDVIVSALGAVEAIVYAGTGPVGEMSIAAGAEATSTTDVALVLSWKTTATTVQKMRFRNLGGPWSNWAPIAKSSSWELVPGEGTKTVEAQLGDADGNALSTLEDSIILDQTPPTGSVLINHGEDETAAPWVTLTLEYTDLQTSVADVRIRNQGSEWNPWDSAATTKHWTIPAVDGLQVVEVQFRDAAGNVSNVTADSITYIPDIVPPKVTAVRVCDSVVYLCPDEEFRVLVSAMDNIGGSGLDAFRVSTGTGSVWCDWISYQGGPATDLPRPTRSGLTTVRAVARDLMGNESAPRETRVFILKSSPSWLGAGGKASGDLSRTSEIDCFMLGLVKGDALNVTPQTRTIEKKQVLTLDLDVVSPAGEKFLVGGYPDDAEEPGIRDWVVPETRRYLVVLRAARNNEAEAGTYKLKVKVKQAKANKKFKGELSGTEIRFDAVAGSKFKASLKGEGIDPAGISLDGPDGPVAIEVAGKPGKARIKGVVLTAGTGTYAIRLASPADVAVKWSVKLPKIKGTVRE